MMQRICSALAWCLILSGLVASCFLASRALRSIYIEVCPIFKGAWEFCHTPVWIDWLSVIAAVAICVAWAVDFSGRAGRQASPFVDSAGHGLKLTARGYVCAVFGSLVLLGLPSTPLTEHFAAAEKAKSAHVAMAEIVNWSKVDVEDPWTFVEYELLRNNASRHWHLLSCPESGFSSGVGLRCDGSDRHLSGVVRTLRAQVAESDAKREAVGPALDQGGRALAFRVMASLLGAALVVLGWSTFCDRRAR